MYSELPPRIAYLFAPAAGLKWEEKAEQAARKHANATETLGAYAAWLKAQTLEGAELGAATKEWIQARGLKIPGLFQPLRCALTGAAGGADLFYIVRLLGPEKTQARIADAIARLS